MYIYVIIIRNVLNLCAVVYISTAEDIFIMFTKDKSFYKSFFTLLSMLALQNMIVLSVNLLDNIMIGSYSEIALSGVTAVNQIQFVFQQILMGAGDTLVVMGSQYWGQQRTEPIKKLANGGLILGCGFGILLFTAASLFPDTLVSIFTDNADYIEKGTEYINIIRFTYIIFPISSILLSSLRSVETVKIAFYSSIVSLIVNGSINYTLINGNFGFPELGVTGAAIGTLTARIIELIIVVTYVLLCDKKLKMKLRDFFAVDKKLVIDYLKTSVAFVTVAALFGLSTALQTVILGHMDIGAEALGEAAGSVIAANSISSTLYMMLKVAAIGAASAASIIIGKTIGQNNIPKVKEYAKTLQFIFIGIGLLTSITLFLLKTPILGLYDISQATRDYAESFIHVLCITCIGTSYQMPVLVGIVRGGGDSRFVLINDLISIWGIVLPVSFLAAFVFNWPPVAVVFCLNADQIFKCGAAAIKVNKFNWIKKLTRAQTESENTATA